MFPLISLPHCVLFPILIHSECHGELWKHGKSTSLSGSTRGLRPRLCHLLVGLGHSRQPFCAAAPLSVRWRWQHLPCRPTWNETKWNETHRPLLLSLFAAAVSTFVWTSTSFFSKCGPTFCYGIFDHVLIYRPCFAFILETRSGSPPSSPWPASHHGPRLSKNVRKETGCDQGSDLFYSEL